MKEKRSFKKYLILGLIGSIVLFGIILYCIIFYNKIFVTDYDPVEPAELKIRTEEIVVADNFENQRYVDARSVAILKIWQTNGEWKSYANKKYGFSFDLPLNWSASEYEANQNFVEIKIVNENLSQDIRNDFAMWLVATKKDYIPDRPTNGAGTCAVDFDNLDSFCAKGCKKINNKTAIDYRIIYDGEPIPSMQAYSTISKNYPAICLSASIYDEINKIVEKEGINQEDVMKKYAPRLLAGSDIPLELQEGIVLFERIAGSISSL